MHQQLLQSAADVEKEQKGDEAGSDDDGELSFQTDVDSSPSIDPLSMSGGIRGLVWERSGGLPTYTTKRPRTSLSEGKIDSPIPSHMSEPLPLPLVNYRHLALAHGIITRRMRLGQGMPISQPTALVRGKSPRIPQTIRPRVIDAISSIDAGGLPGHAETVYALQLIARQMTIDLGKKCPDCHPDAPFDMTRHAHARAQATVSGRDWLLSSSRDHTLRLWQLGVRPKVVRVFHDGHTGSVLCHAVVHVPVLEARGKARRRGSIKGKTKVMAVSGGSDGRVCLWDIEHGDGRPEKVIEAHTASVLCIRADDERVVTSSKGEFQTSRTYIDRTIRVFDITTLDERLVINCNGNDHHRSAINSVALSKDYV